MDYTEYFMEQAIDGDGPLLTDHGPAASKREQAERRFTRRDNYRAVVVIDVGTYFDSLQN